MPRVAVKDGLISEPICSDFGLVCLHIDLTYLELDLTSFMVMAIVYQPLAARPRKMGFCRIKPMAVDWIVDRGCEEGGE
jgi:hypothetical protein